ncbi:glycosyltransferase [Plantactinospora sonchi]|uniref:Glycosyltransferase n=1 Tax=Plantactinospora sonchi TaxID=1544735 RepID=A0ABU7RRB4_9ACTN
MTDTGTVVVDSAGGATGGAARWRAELDAFLGAPSGVGPDPAPGSPPGSEPDARSVTVIGRRQQLTPGWLVQRERLAGRATLAVAPNNVSFALGGDNRTVLLRNALHFLYPAEAHLLDRMPRSFRLQIPVVRRLLRRADLIVVPCGAMGERVVQHVPSARNRIVVRPHPVTPAGPRVPGADPFILVPVVPGPYKNLTPQLAALLDALDRTGRRIRITVTARPADLPAALAGHPMLDPIGIVAHHELTRLWRSATAVFYPSALEAFGYPLAEARAYGVPVLSPESGQSREVAGGALLPYRPDEPDSLADALDGLDGTVIADPAPFDRNDYFRWLLRLPGSPASAATPHAPSVTGDGHCSGGRPES